MVQWSYTFQNELKEKFAAIGSVFRQDIQPVFPVHHPYHPFSIDWKDNPDIVW
jgi:hypothetical protein